MPGHLGVLIFRILCCFGCIKRVMHVLIDNLAEILHGPDADIVLVGHDYGRCNGFPAVPVPGVSGKPVILDLLGIVVDGGSFAPHVKMFKNGSALGTAEAASSRSPCDRCVHQRLHLPGRFRVDGLYHHFRSLPKNQPVLERGPINEIGLHHGSVVDDRGSQHGSMHGRDSCGFVETAGDFRPVVRFFRYGSNTGIHWQVKVHFPVESECVCVLLQPGFVQVELSDFAEHRVNGFGKSLFQGDVVGVSIDRVFQLGPVQGILATVKGQPGVRGKVTNLQGGCGTNDFKQAGCGKGGVQTVVDLWIIAVMCGHDQDFSSLGVHNHDADLPGISLIHHGDCRILQMFIQGSIKGAAPLWQLFVNHRGLRIDQIIRIDKLPELTAADALDFRHGCNALSPGAGLQPVKHKKSALDHQQTHAQGKHIYRKLPEGLLGRGFLSEPKLVFPPGSALIFDLAVNGFALVKSSHDAQMCPLSDGFPAAWDAPVLPRPHLPAPLPPTPSLQNESP